MISIKPARFLEIFLPFILFSFGTKAQLSTPPLADNQKSQVSQWMGIVELSVTYNSPDVTSPKGESRRGNIWGKLVPYGLMDERWLENEGQPTTAKPWRAGANETTVFRTSHDVLIEGVKLPAGEYGLFFIAGEKEWQVIFSKDSKTWGHYFYNDKNDVLRVKVTPEKSDYHEWLTYEFIDRKLDKSELALFWEDLKVPIHISIPDVRKVYIEKIKEELSGNKLRYWYNWQEAATYCLDNNIELELGLQWAEKAVNQGWIGNANFSTLKTKADLLYALNRKIEADSLMEFAIHFTGGVFELHNYGRELLQKNKLDEAFKVLKYNATIHPNYWVTDLGMARAYGAKGDFKTALKYAHQAKKTIPKQEWGMRQYSIDVLIEQLEKKQLPRVFAFGNLRQEY